jgi:stearoyl-CoA desaturase (delta-9 desaturase)
MKLSNSDGVAPKGRTRKTNWGTGVFLLIAHLVAIAALFFFSWSGLITAIILYWVGGSLGIGMGYHRLITHRGFSCPLWLEHTFAILGTCCLQFSPAFWVAVHRRHHHFADEEQDPHSPLKSFVWAHFGWLRGTAQDHDEATIKRYAPDLITDRYYNWLNRYYYVPLIVLSVLLLVLGGWSVLLWGTFLRVTLALHATWFVNSATHMWGRKRFETGEDSRNSWWVALLTFGEGWHNNHHAYPTSARHGLR